MTDLRTPLARARGLGSGKTGTSHFWYQRVTAVALMLLVPWLVWMLAGMAGGDVESVRATIARPWNAILLAAFSVAMFWHAKLGIQVVIEDYVHNDGMKLALIVLMRFIAVFFGLAGIVAILRIGFGG